jgi:hypothetical protein
MILTCARATQLLNALTAAFIPSGCCTFGWLRATTACLRRAPCYFLRTRSAVGRHTGVPPSVLLPLPLLLLSTSFPEPHVTKSLHPLPFSLLLGAGAPAAPPNPPSVPCYVAPLLHPPLPKHSFSLGNEKETATQACVKIM